MSQNPSEQPGRIIADPVFPSPPTDEPAEYGWVRRAALLLTGQAFSLLGSSIVQFAIWWWIVLQTRTGSAMLLATLFGVLPQALVSVFGGPLADRYNRKALIVLPDLVIAAVTALLSIAFATGWASLSLIFVALLIRAAGAGIQQPAVQSFIPDIVPEKGLLRVNSIFGVIDSANRIAAPAIAAVLVNVAPLWSILLVDVTTAVIGVGFVALIRMPATPKGIRTATDTAGTDGGETSGRSAEPLPLAVLRRTFADLRAGFAYTMRHPYLKGAVLGDAFTCFLSVAPMNLTLLLMTREYDGLDLDLGFVNLTTASDKLAANELGLSVGMLLGGALMSAIGPRLLNGALVQMRAIALGIGMVGLTVIGLGLAPNLLVYLVIDVLNGVASAVCVGPMRTVMQSESDESMTGRVFGLDTMLSTLGMPLGMLVFAPLADVIPIVWVFVAGGLLTLPVAWYVLALSRRSVPGKQLPGTA
ncbi:MFS transporter [Bifidobacterium stellenboschense]|uniref:Transporter, major facilitator family protein n=1 Tax=Bifidobacterium stellenboschense TaxID=762211 RepID=A0A087DPU4_9BIFI|nr:MFS transporter [Bifidobacterium stellenboschense]KFI97544.1 transporter, major facilitator family protein [Bifidobacterium stellenboschense]